MVPAFNVLVCFALHYIVNLWRIWWALIFYPFTSVDSVTLDQYTETVEITFYQNPVGNLELHKRKCLPFKLFKLIIFKFICNWISMHCKCKKHSFFLIIHNYISNSNYNNCFKIKLVLMSLCRISLILLLSNMQLLNQELHKIIFNSQNYHEEFILLSKYCIFYF